MLMLDSRLEDLPVEALKVFSKIPTIARDFSLHMYMLRIKQVGHQAALHNNQGIAKDNLKYIVDPPEPLADTSKQFLE